MKNGIVGGPLPAGLPYGVQIEAACDGNGFSPLLAYAIKINETGLPSDPPDTVSGDGGHGLFQLTSSYPPDWADPFANASYAITQFLAPAYAYWAAQGYIGDQLIKLVAATFNEGISAAIEAHVAGDVDAGTTNDYGARAVANYHMLLAQVSRDA